MSNKKAPIWKKYLNFILIFSLIIETQILNPFVAFANELEEGIKEIIDFNLIDDNIQNFEDNVSKTQQSVLNEKLDYSLNQSTGHPVLNVELISNNMISAVNGDEIEITYQISSESFVTNSQNNNSKDKTIAVLIDISKRTEVPGGIGLEEVKQSIINKILNEFHNSNRNYLNMAFIPYSQSSEILDKLVNSGETKDELREKLESVSTSDSMSSNLNTALQKAKTFLDNDKNSNSSKNLVIISFGDPTDELTDENQYKNYNIITLDIAKKVNDSGDLEKHSKLESWHERLGGSIDNYIYAENIENKLNNGKMEEVANKIKGFQGERTYIIQPELYFDLGTNFSHVSGLTPIKDTTMYKLDVSSLIYIRNDTKNEDGTYTYTASEQIGKFKIKVNTDRTGLITFNQPDSSENNYFTYSDINGNRSPNINIETPSIYIGSKYTNENIKILEIEPADYFKLGSKTGLTTGTEVLDVEGKTVEMTRITMPEFIGSVEKINGKYDIIVLGRLVNTSWGNDVKKQKKYQDYNFRRSQDFEENDITNRKAQEIIDFIDSGQLVYIDKNILKEDIKETKLYRNFKSIEEPNLIKNQDMSEISLDKIIAHYNNNISPQQKQIQLEVIDATPSDITTNDINSVDGIAANRTRKMIISANSLNSLTDNSQISEDVSITLYLDLDGDGLFSDNEVAVSREGLKTPLDRVVLNYNIHHDFLGLLTWKLEVTKGDSNNLIKTYLTGDMNFHRLPERPKKNINVLQIIPQDDYKSADKTGNIDNNGEYKILDLSENTAFEALLDSVALKDYQIDVTTISVTEYNHIVEKTTQISDFEMGIKELNGYYDMLILGFSDCYTGCTSKFGINDTGVQNIYDFIKTGQGLMLTHDTLFYERETDVERSKNHMLNLFRGISGQARYGLGTGIETETNKIYGALKDLDGSDIPYDPDKPSITELSKYSGSASVWQDSGSMGRLTASPMVYETNTALITEYPFNLITTGNTLGIRKTHAQYLQLNLEDESVVPWYTLFGSTDSRVNPYDVRNNYYTYSRNNITFSGTGENRREFAPYPDLEMKLFINTIVKAERGANHAPTLELVNIDESKKISKHQQRLTFDVIPYDMDLDNMKLSIEVFGCQNKICSDTPFLQQIDSDYIRTNGVNVNIDFNIQNQLTNFDHIEIKVIAIDEHNASSHSRELVIELTNEALLDVSFTPDKDGYLIGDDASVTTTIKANGNAAKEGQFSLITPLSSFINGVGKTTFNFNIGSNETISEKFYFTVNNSQSIQTDNNTRIDVAANYSYCLEINSTSCVEIADKKTAVLNVKRGQVIVEFSSNVSNLFIDNEIVVQLLDSNREVLETKNVNKNSNNVIFDAVPSGDYFVRILKPDNLSEDNYVLQSAEGSLESPDWGKEYGFTISYNQNVKTFHAEINELRFDLVHGILKSQTDTDIVIEPSIDQTNPKQVTGNTLVNFAAIYSTKQGNNNALLTVSNKLKGISEKSIQVYRIETDSSSKILSIQPFIGAVVTKEDQVYRITLPNNTESDVKVLIHYAGLVPNENIDITNRIAVGVTDMNVFIGVNQEMISNPEQNSYLPNLF